MNTTFNVIRARPGSVAAKLLGEGSTPQSELPVGFVVTRILAPRDNRAAANEHGQRTTKDDASVKQGVG